MIRPKTIRWFAMVIYKGRKWRRGSDSNRHKTDLQSGP